MNAQTTLIMQSNFNSLDHKIMNRKDYTICCPPSQGGMSFNLETEATDCKVFHRTGVRLELQKKEEKKDRSKFYIFATSSILLKKQLFTHCISIGIHILLFPGIQKFLSQEKGKKQKTNKQTKKKESTHLKTLFKHRQGLLIQPR